MARCSPAKPLCTTAAAPRPSRRRGLLISASASPATTSTRTHRLLALPKPPKPPPPPPLLPRPRLPISNDAPTNGKPDDRREPSTGAASSGSGSSSGAGDVLRLMGLLRVAPDEDVYVSLLRDSVDAAEVAAVHAHVAATRAASGLPLPLANRLLLAYATCGDMAAARKVFDEIPVKDGITWATMVSAYSDGCFHDEAIRLFTRMCQEEQGLAGDLLGHAIVAVLRSCARLGRLRGFGQQVHALVIKTKRVCGDTGSSLLQLYIASNQHDSARQVLQAMRCCSQEPVPEAAWTSFMTACHRDGLLDEAIYVFRDMVSSGVPRSSFSLSTILAVCAESENCRCYGQQVHGDAIKHGVETDQFVMSGLVHMYAKQGRLADATRAFEAVGGKPDAVCWNAMAMGYARGGRYREATRMMYQMKAAGLDLPGLNVVGMACSS
ncbi:pentatricopeptide repeat-containing protein At1g31790-like [Triticum urartu]|nr:pentatricopeptide repeat-containing protein At1g31790-like [Triticum urartu]XP_048547826.1 pentatricopeptide repeat-containing protein At1g31790-like [Triticum urartu]XP_048547827.1 pentatricopeptide repeat-containing protein At1g31790-like [Triticum urartu]XP_048572695.1 pentatricopeptide repeat-containing protein At1g31790-like [Triticum urartu]XP_048572696.1 pentatricopeptide repeat-containing protein At1g31790-like [Triticum urartu]XP_048572698.1 pentatricopeptide repeat-containing prot